MHREHLQYLYLYMSKFKSASLSEKIQQISHVFQNYKQITRGVVEKLPLNAVYKLPHREQVMAKF